MDNQQLFMKNLNDFINYTEGVITIIGFDSEEYNKSNLKEVIANCKCSNCGSVFKMSLSKLKRSVHCFKNCCPNCKEDYRKQQIIKRHKGIIHGVLEFVDFDHFEKGRAFVKCKCTRCGEITIVRDDKLKGNYKPTSCDKCYPKFNGEQIHKRCLQASGLSDEEYERTRDIRNRIQSFKRGAKQRNISYNLSDEFAEKLLQQECYYCGTSEFIGIDRLDSLKGYSEDNCVSCCKYCNLMKNKLSYDLFTTQISKIFKYRINSSTTIENTSKGGSE